MGVAAQEVQEAVGGCLHSARYLHVSGKISDALLGIGMLTVGVNAVDWAIRWVCL